MNCREVMQQVKAQEIEVPVSSELFGGACVLAEMGGSGAAPSGVFWKHSCFAKSASSTDFNVIQTDMSSKMKRGTQTAFCSTWEDPACYQI